MPMTKPKDAVITVKSVYDGDRTDRQAFIELILQRQQKLRDEPRNGKENVDGDRNQTYNYITPDAVYTA